MHCIVCTAAVLFSNCLNAAAESPTIVTGDVGRQLDACCEQRPRNDFSGTVLISQAGKIVLQKGYGLANREQKIPNGPDTLFEIASLAKQFTAAAVLALEDDGQLSTDDPIAAHLPEVPDAYKGVTIYHLLTHTAGLPRGGGGRGLDVAAVVRGYLSQAPQFVPGKKYAYANGGYALLAAIVESASGQTLEAYCRTRLFSRADLAHTGFCGEEFNLQQVALGYTDGRSAGRPPHRDPYPPYDEFGYEYRGMGGVVTSATDLYRWVGALRDGRVLSAAARRKLFQPFRNNYACGWEVFTFDEGQRCIGHGGTVRGFVSKLWMFPDDDMVMIVLSNDQRFDYTMLSDLKHTLFQEPRAPQADPRDFTAPPPARSVDEQLLRSLAGNYVYDRSSALQLNLQARANGLQARLSGITGGEISEQFRDEANLARAILREFGAGEVDLLATHMHPGIPESWPGRMEASIWPQHTAAWGRLRDVKLVFATEMRREDEPWVFVWMNLIHAEGDCLACVAFRPQRKLQLLYLDVNGSFCADGQVFVARSPSEFSPNDGHLVKRIEFLERDKLLLTNSATSLIFRRETATQP